MDVIITIFTLNKEQERVFHIIANHAVEPNLNQLKMYLGGIAGIGKSQVIKALMKFFADRKESHRFIYVAPTETAASLIPDSTYHSILKINMFNRDESNMQSVQNRLKQIDYLFLDGISMVNQYDFYNICSKMYNATGNKIVLFGEINIICAGDFAQLKPVAGNALYKSDLSRVIHNTHSHILQEEAIASAIWHQFTTVVILRQNM